MITIRRRGEGQRLFETFPKMCPFCSSGTSLTKKQSRQSVLDKRSYKELFETTLIVFVTVFGLIILLLAEISRPFGRKCGVVEIARGAI